MKKYLQFFRTQRVNIGIETSGLAASLDLEITRAMTDLSNFASFVVNGNQFALSKTTVNIQKLVVDRNKSFSDHTSIVAP